MIISLTTKVTEIVYFPIRIKMIRLTIINKTNKNKNKQKKAAMIMIIIRMPKII